MIVIAIAERLFGKNAALQLLNILLRLNPNSDSAYAQRGRLYFQQGEKQKGLQDLETAARLNPNNPLAYVSLSTIYLDMGDTERALQALDTAEQHTTNDPKSTVVRQSIAFNRGVILMRNKAHVAAVKAFEASLAVVEESIRREETAKSNPQTVRVSYPHDKSLMYLTQLSLAVAFMAFGETTQAVSLYRQVKTNAPELIANTEQGQTSDFVETLRKLQAAADVTH